jgi:CHASE2 domain-containing sensor protein
MKLGWTLNGKKVPSLVGEVVNIYVGDKLVRTDDDNVNIKFAPTNFTIIHPDSILQHRQEIEGRIVFFGSMAEETDMHYTPLGKIAGVELLAYATQTLLEHSQIIEPPMWMQVIIAILLVMLTNMMQLLYLGWTSRSKSPLVYHVMGSAYLLGLVTFMWIALIMWFTFLFFCMYNVSMEIGWSIAAMAFLATSRSFYAACEDYYKLWKERK